MSIATKKRLEVVLKEVADYGYRFISRGFLGEYVGDDKMVKKWYDNGSEKVVKNATERIEKIVNDNNL